MTCRRARRHPARCPHACPSLPRLRHHSALRTTSRCAQRAEPARRSEFFSLPPASVLNLVRTQSNVFLTSFHEHRVTEWNYQQHPRCEATNMRPERHTATRLLHGGSVKQLEQEVLTKHEPGWDRNDSYENEQ